MDRRPKRAALERPPMLMGEKIECEYKMKENQDTESRRGKKGLAS